MARITYLRSKMSKTKDMAMTIGIDSTQNLDRDHDMYFVRSMIDLKRTLEEVNENKPYFCKLENMGGRYLFFFRNDDDEITKKSLSKIFDLCKSFNIKEIVFSEYEIRNIIPELNDIISEYDIQVYITIF